MFSTVMNEDKELVLPFNDKDILPKNKLDRSLFISMAIGLPSFLIWETFVLYMYHPKVDYIWAAHFILQGFIHFNILGNLYYFLRVDSSGKKQKLPTLLCPNWTYCHFCQQNSPPRSYHCSICDECILKRDQHCMFAGCCVGFYNHRYQFVAIIYVMIGSLYAFILQWPHCLESIGGFHLLSIVSLIIPHIAVVFGFISFYGFFCAITQVILFCVHVFAAYMLVVQICCISQGQTIHEKRAGITLYDLGWKKNFLQVLGKHWLWSLVCPMIKSPLFGDGLTFPTFYDLEEIKNV